MNPYRFAISMFGLTAENQNYYGQLYLMLSMLAGMEDANPTANTYSNGWQELLHRMRDYAETHAVKQLAQLIGTRVSE